MSRRNGATYSGARIAARVDVLGKEISSEYRGRRLDVLGTLDRGFVFAADLIRCIDVPMVCHFFRADVRDVDEDGHSRREISFGSQPEVGGRDILLVDAVLDSGVGQDFLLRRLGESRPRSIRLAVLGDKPGRRPVDLEPDYFGFRTASNQVWAGHGLAAANGTPEKRERAYFRNEPCGPKEWQWTEKESMIEAALGGFRN